MKVIIFGATGMVGQGVVRECLLDESISSVQLIGRSVSKVSSPKVKELITSNLYNYDAFEEDLKGFDACFFCLGVSSAGMNEKDYTYMTHDLAIAAGKKLAQLNPQMTFIYVSGEGTDSSEKGNVMWARVKGRLENDLLKLFPNAYMFRPGMIEPKHGAVSKTKSYRIIYGLLFPVMPLFHLIMPKFITTTERVGKAMLSVAHKGHSKKILSNMDINVLGKTA